MPRNINAECSTLPFSSGVPEVAIAVLLEGVLGGKRGSSVERTREKGGEGEGEGEGIMKHNILGKWKKGLRQ